MKHHTPMTNGDEYDALTGWRRSFHWKAGIRSRTKRSYRRRERKVLNSNLQALDQEYCTEVWFSDFRPDWMRKDSL